MLTYKDIVDQIKSSDFSYYRLRGRSDEFTSQMVRIGDNISESSPTVDQVLNHVEKHVKRYTNGNPNYIFELDLLKTPTSSSSGVHGPFIFKKTIEGSVANVPAAPQQNLSEMLGLGQIKEMLNVQSSLLEPRLQLEREKTEVYYQQKELEREKKLFQEEKSKTIKELEDLKTKYESKSETAKAGAEKAIWAVLDAFVKDDKNGLSGATAKIEEETEEDTPERKMIESIAENIDKHYKNEDIDLKGIEKIGVQVQLTINKLKEDKK